MAYSFTSINIDKETGQIVYYYDSGNIRIDVNPVSKETKFQRKSDMVIIFFEITKITKANFCSSPTWHQTQFPITRFWSNLDISPSELVTAGSSGFAHKEYRVSDRRCGANYCCESRALGVHFVLLTCRIFWRKGWRVINFTIYI